MKIHHCYFLSLLVVGVFGLLGVVSVGCNFDSKISDVYSADVQFDKNQRAPLITHSPITRRPASQEKVRLGPMALGVVSAPVLQVFADGRILIGKNEGTVEFESKLSEKELQNLLNFVINENKIYECDTESIAVVLANGGWKNFFNWPQSDFCVEIGGKKHNVQLYGIDNFIQGPKFPEYLHLWRIRKYLNRIEYVAAIGGNDRFEEVLAQVNSKLKEERPDLEPLDLSNLNRGIRQASGRVHASIGRFYYKTGKGEKVVLVGGTYKFDPQIGPRYTFSVNNYKNTPTQIKW